MKDPAGIQKAQFEKISQDYTQVHGRVHAAIFGINQLHYYPRLAGHSVLDVGNGGQTPEVLLGRELSLQVPFFVGVDNSVDMLRRTEMLYVKVAASGLALPFADRSFEYVIVNGVLHHLGLRAGEDQYHKVRQFFMELKRVCRKEILIYEIFLPKVFEWLERAGLLVLRHMPTFVLAQSTLTGYLARMGMPMREVRTHNLGNLLGPWYWYTINMDYTWLRIPACVNPFQNTFFTIPMAD